MIDGVMVKQMMKVVLYDSRDGSPTKEEVNEFFLGEHRPIVLRIPPHENDIPYKWARKDG